jgi:LysR family transcriptional regulator, regulator for metE and metH
MSRSESETMRALPPHNDDPADARGEFAEDDTRLTLDVRHMRLVRTIAQEGSVTRAASRLNATQSALSHQLLNLERVLGLKMFDRIGKRMVATAAAESLLQTSTEVLHLLGVAERELRALGAGRPSLRIAAGCYTYYAWLAGGLARFGAARPDIDVQIELEHTRHELDALAKGEIDVAVTSRLQQNNRFSHQKLFALDVVAILPSSHPKASGEKKELRWSELRGERILVHDIADYDIQQIREAVCGKGRQTETTKIHRVQLTEAIAALAAAGHGVGIVTRWPGSLQGVKGVKILSLRPSGKREFWAVWRRGNPRGLPIPILASHLALAQTARRAR